MITTSIDILYIAVAFILIVIAGSILYAVIFKMDLTHLLSESGDGKASLSRLQLLIFTLVIASIYATLCLEQQKLLDIEPGVLGLLGISVAGYGLGKGIKQKSGDGPAAPNPPPAPAE